VKIILVLLALLFMWGGALFYFWARSFCDQVARLPTGEKKEDLASQAEGVRVAGMLDMVLGLALSLIIWLFIS
jgi:hypothetical protein